MRSDVNSILPPEKYLISICQLPVALVLPVLKESQSHEFVSLFHEVLVLPHSSLAARLAPEYGIDYRTPVFAIHRNGHYGGIVGHGFDNLKEFHRLVLKAGEEGADFIKIMTTGLLDFKNHGKVTGEPLEAEEVKEMVHIAHEEGFAVMSHTNGAYGTRAAIEAGVDSLEHGNYMDEETLSMLAESDTVWVPTLVTVRNLIGCGRYDDEVLRPIIVQAENLVRLAFVKKVKVAPGSDAGAYMVPHGKGICQEYEAFCEILGDTSEVKEWLHDGEREIRERFRSIDNFCIPIFFP